MDALFYSGPVPTTQAPVDEEGDEFPQDIFEEGDVIHVTSEGDATPALDMEAMGVETLDVSEEFPYPSFQPGEDYTLTWRPPRTRNPSRIQVLIETGWHGSPSLTTVWCETEDDGEIVIPASLTAQVPIPSCGNCESSTLRRFTRDVVDFGQGPIELMVASGIWFLPWWGK